MFEALASRMDTIAQSANVELVSKALSLGIYEGKSLSAEDIYSNPSLSSFIPLINSVAPGCNNKWPDVFKGAAATQALKQANLPQLLDILFCGKSWRAAPSASFNWKNH